MQVHGYSSAGARARGEEDAQARHANRVCELGTQIGYASRACEGQHEVQVCMQDRKARGRGDNQGESQ